MITVQWDLNASVLSHKVFSNHWRATDCFDSIVMLLFSSEAAVVTLDQFITNCT